MKRAARKAREGQGRKVTEAKPKSKFAQIYIESSRILGRHLAGYPNPNEIVIDLK